MSEELPFMIVRSSDSEVLARELFRVIANVNFPEEVLLKQRTRVIASSTASK
jgi:hypothetical protein